MDLHRSDDDEPIEEKFEATHTRQGQKRLANEKPEEERSHSKQQRALDLEDYLEQNCILLSEAHKQEFMELIPKIVETFKKDANLMKRMEGVKDQKGLESFLSTWYYRLDLEENEMERLDNWLEKFEDQVMGALRQKLNIASTSQENCNFFTTLKEKFFRKRMKEICAEEMSKKLELEKQREMKIVTEETRKTLQSVNISGLPDEFINEIAEQSYIAIEARRQGPSSEPVPMRISQSLREGVLKHLDDLFVPMNLSKPTPVCSQQVVKVVKQEVPEEAVVSPALLERHYIHIVKQEDIPEEAFVSPALLERQQKSVNHHKATETQRKEHQRKKYLDKHSKSVHFVDYKSPKNTMRIFMKPNGYISETADDSPITPFVDLTLEEGRKIMEQIPRPHTVSDEYRPDKLKWRYLGRMKLAAFRDRDWLKEYDGNLLGRFWIIRRSLYVCHLKAQHFQRCIHGILHDYSEPDLKTLYSFMLKSEFDGMRRSNRRESMPNSGERKGKRTCDPMNGVLLLTDWRLLFLEKHALLNACVRFMPTNIGDTFFDSMTAYLIELINDPNLEIHTIIFAFGGHPLFNKKAFTRFWQKLIQETLKSIDVVWTAQDWCDGLESTEKELAHLTDFNNYVKKIFEIMSDTGHSNYKFCNIREKYQIPMKNLKLTFDKNGNPDVSPLQNLYFSYMDWFQSVSDFYCNGVFFTFNHPKTAGYKEDSNRFPRQRDIHPEAIF